MTTATHTFPNGAVVQIDLEAIPDEARWLTMDDDSWAIWSVKPMFVSGPNDPQWTPCTIKHYLGDVLDDSVISGTLPAWSECIIDLEAVRESLMTDDGQYHSVDWHGTFMGTDSDPRETGWCDECQSEVYDGDPMGHTNRPDDGQPRLYDVVTDGHHSWWVVSYSREKGTIGLDGGMRTLIHHFQDCWPIARNVYDIREAMRLMGENDE